MAERNKNGMRFSERELTLMKSVFAENDDLLIAMRKFFLQFPLTESEDKLLIKTFGKKKELLALVRKTFLPTLDGDAPLGQMIDLWATMPIKDKDPDSAYLVAKMTESMIAFFEQQLTALENIGTLDDVLSNVSIVYSDFARIEGKDREQIWIDMMTRNTVYQQVDVNLNQLLILAGFSEESVDETMNRLRKNSNK